MATARHWPGICKLAVDGEKEREKLTRIAKYRSHSKDTGNNDPSQGAVKLTARERPVDPKIATCQDRCVRVIVFGYVRSCRPRHCLLPRCESIYVLFHGVTSSRADAPPANGFLFYKCQGCLPGPLSAILSWSAV
uniref:Uncharacterized protein n=1 Tax=Branchiostoma floridae TaxID=7739 RepID=C3XTE2_BRAFL|eukprot:XP_002612722.1 hypothetical protein BRAFLDRAFT_99515 [Branchiostoma floridae]